MTFRLFAGALTLGALGKGIVSTSTLPVSSFFSLFSKKEDFECVYNSEVPKAYASSALDKPLMRVGNATEVAAITSNPNPVFDHHFRPFKLGEVINLAEDVAIFRFLTPNQDDVFSLEPCSTLQLKQKSGGNAVDSLSRFYTPITQSGTKGFFDILVKKQPNGRMTETLFSLKPGDSLLVRTISYKLSYSANKFKHVGMIAGGTGITPMYQVIQHSITNPKDKTKLSLLFANVRPSKILLRGCLDEHVKNSNGRFDVHYVVDKLEEEVPEDCTDVEKKNRASNNKGVNLTGFITKKMIRDTMPAPGEPDTKVLICGSDKFMAHVCGAPFGVLKAMSGSSPIQPLGVNLNNFSEPEGLMGELGYKMEQLYRF